MRAFVFSLDAFVAFILALVAVYSLIFFSSVPSGYYYLLTQAHYLSRDALMTVSTTQYEDWSGCISCPVTGTVLDYILYESSVDVRKDTIHHTVGKIVPNQFGYTLEYRTNETEDWHAIYDTRNPSLRVPDDEHAMDVSKVKVSSELVNFGFEGAVQKEEESPYVYRTCTGGESGEGIVITCGDYNMVEPGGEEGLVPSPDVAIVRLTVFI